MTQQAGNVLVSIGIRADSILLNRARIPVYTAIRVFTVIVAGGLGWCWPGPGACHCAKLTEQTSRLSGGPSRCPR